LNPNRCFPSPCHSMNDTYKRRGAMSLQNDLEAI
jgi:hypothetical protein